MPFFKVDADALMSSEMIALSPEATRLWLMAGTWLSRYNQGFRFSPKVLGKSSFRDCTKAQADELVAAGLWERMWDEWEQPYRFIASWHWDFSANEHRRKIPRKLRDEVLRRDRMRCVQCAAEDELQIDHIFPYSRGGTETIENLQVLCGPCNRAKGATVECPPA